MHIGSLILEPTLVALAAALMTLVSALIWWLVRKRQSRVWLPTVRVMRFETRVLPRLVLRLPPLVPFLCFVAAALALLGFSLRPKTAVFTPFAPKRAHIHVFVDESPSIAAHVSLEELADRMAALYTTLKPTGRVTFSTSHEAQLFEPQSAAEVRALVKAHGFHRAGLRLGAAMKELSPQLGATDRLFVVSDRDQHSWTGFNWQFLGDDMDVVFYDLTQDGKAPGRNLFINDARFHATPSSPTMEWDVEIARQGEAAKVDGRLEVTFMGKSLGSFPWTLPADKQRIDVQATWPASLVQVVGEASARDVPLVFRINVDGGDALAADNEFRSAVKGLRQDVLLIAEPAGERQLEDPAHELEVALEIQGFRVIRRDYLADDESNVADYPFIVLLGGAGSTQFCPRSLATARLAAQAQRMASGSRRAAALPKVWLAPEFVDSDYRALCRCYARLLLSSSQGASAPAYCAEVNSRARWLNLLPSLGAVQVGGAIGDSAGSLAWHAVDQGSGLDMLAFSVPLRPLTATGINHAVLPLLVKDLLAWQGLIEPQLGAQPSWPRIADQVEKLWKIPATATPDELARLRTTNVPLGESLLGSVDAAELPPRWSAESQASVKQLPAKKDSEDPLPWLKLAAAVAALSVAFEALFGLGTRFLRLVRRRPETLALLALLLLPSRAFGKVELGVIGYGASPMTLSSLAREVSHRTSIELAPKPVGFAQVTPDALSEPWLWVKDLAKVTKDGVLRPDVRMWIERGGLLVLEVPSTPQALAKLTAKMRHGGGWLPVPPDHELMRSFYLLDALPSCNGEIWRGFEYDGRLAILAVPYDFLSALKDNGTQPACLGRLDTERQVRVFVNVIMVALATDYKKDQIHLPEILKRLR